MNLKCIFEASMKFKRKKHKILFAAVDIGWRIAQYKNFLNQKFKDNVHIKSFVKHKVSKQQYQTNYDFEFQFIKYPKIIQWLIAFAFFFYALTRFNTFYFFSGETILTRKLRRFEFSIYRFFNKKIIMHFVGSDIRDPNYLFWKADNINDYLAGKKPSILSTKWQKKLIIDSNNFAKHIIVSTPDLLQIIPQANYFPVVINIEQFMNELKVVSSQSKSKIFKSNKIKILHAPSNSKVKGSRLIDSIMEKLLQNNDKIEYLNTLDLQRNTGSVYSVSRYELFQLYTEADIVIDQMVIGWYGLQSIEALLAKCFVICYVEDKLKKYLFHDCPIIISDISKLENHLLDTINKVMNNQSDFTKQIEWVKKYHTIKNNNSKLLAAFNNE